jgi:hypothetical protein
VPTISLAVNTLAATAPGSVQLVPTISDPSSLVTKVECYRDSALIYTKLAAPFGYTDSGLAAGTYSYTEKLYYSGRGGADHVERGASHDRSSNATGAGNGRSNHVAEASGALLTQTRHSDPHLQAC